MKKFLFFLIICSNLILTQEPCDGTCLSEEETKNLFNNIQECEFDKEKCEKKVLNLNDQILILNQYIENDSLIVSQLEYQLKLKDDMIKLVKPKWYENKYLWFFMGFFTFYGATEAASNIK